MSDANDPQPLDTLPPRSPPEGAQQPSATVPGSARHLPAPDASLEVSLPSARPFSASTAGQTIEAEAPATRPPVPDAHHPRQAVRPAGLPAGPASFEVLGELGRGAMG